ncbi:Unknown protein [Striga hermonthica]|uniref:Reverse transcriptase n=1 Tax=Striga hermonthica TaxID=68872 RepID=A0A9N7R9K4_STRHE|nr:Unknown protein [Striga hermonthica]
MEDRGYTKNKELPMEGLSQLHPYKAKEALYKRKVTAEPYCHRCKADFSETIEHILFLCPKARQVWFGSYFGYKIRAEQFDTLDRWLEQIFTLKEIPASEKKEILTKIAFICWNLWKSRCRENDTILKGLNQTEKWQKPEAEWVKLNCDACFDSLTKNAAFGIVARDSRGVVIELEGGKMKTESASAAEAYAVREAVQMVERKKWPKVVIESDSENVIKNIRKEEPVPRSTPSQSPPYGKRALPFVHLPQTRKLGSNARPSEDRFGGFRALAGGFPLGRLSSRTE